MANDYISQVTLPNKQVYDLAVKANNIIPTLQKTYTGNFYGTGDNYDSTSFFFISLKPDTWYKPWKIKFKIRSYCPAHTECDSVTYGLYTGRLGSYSYANWNERNDSYAHYYTSVRTLNKTGFDAGLSHALGICLRYASNYTNTGWPRTFEVEIYDYEGCTVTLLDAPLLWANWPNAANNYNGWSVPDAITRGLCETNDATGNNDDRTLQDIMYFRFKSGAAGIGRYTLLMEESTGVYSSLTTTFPTSNTPLTILTMNTGVKYKLGRIIYFNQGANRAANTNIGNDNQYFTAYSLIDGRYTFQYAAGALTAYKPFYMVGTLDSNGFFTIDPAATAWTQNLPTANTTKVYVYLGTVYPDTNPYRIAFELHHPIYTFKDGALKEIHPGVSSGNADTATAANLTTTTNAITYYTNTTGTFGSKASANGALYATSANGALSWGTLPVAQGGTGATTAADARTNLGLGSAAVQNTSYFVWNGGNYNLGSGSPAANAKAYYEASDGMTEYCPYLTYNTSGVEYTLLFTGRKQYGSILKWGYNDTYIRILRRYNNSWQNSDWEKISAGYADTVATASDTSSTLYLLGVTSSATTTVKYNSSVTITGGTVSAASLSLSDTTDSTSSSTGTLKVAGGVQVGKNIYLGHAIKTNTQQTLFVGSAQRSQWYKITLPESGTTAETSPPSNALRWYMHSMTINVGGDYNAGPRGKIELTYYIYWDKTKFNLFNGYATAIGPCINQVKIYYDLSKPFEFYIYTNNSYSSIWVSHLHGLDSAASYDTAATKVEVASSAPDTNSYTLLPMVYMGNNNNFKTSWISWNTIIPAATNSYDLGTSSYKWANIYATTFTGNLTGNVTGNVTGNCSGSSGSCTGNAATATKFNSTRKIELTGAITGSATTDGSNGWSISTTVNHNHDDLYVNVTGDTMISSDGNVSLLTLKKSDDLTSWPGNMKMLTLVGYDNKEFSFKFSGSGKNVDVGYDWNAGHGAGIALRSSDHGAPGSFIIYARKDTSAEYALTGSISNDNVGILTWCSKRVVTATNSTQIGSATQPVYISDTGQALKCTAYADATVGNANKVAAKLATTTKAYLLGTSATINASTATNVDLIGDMGVYLWTEGGSLSAKSYYINDGTNEKVRMEWNSTDQSLDFVFA